MMELSGSQPLMPMDEAWCTAAQPSPLPSYASSASSTTTSPVSPGSSGHFPCGQQEGEHSQSQSVQFTPTPDLISQEAPPAESPVHTYNVFFQEAVNAIMQLNILLKTITTDDNAMICSMLSQCTLLEGIALITNIQTIKSAVRQSGSKLASAIENVCLLVYSGNKDAQQFMTSMGVYTKQLNHVESPEKQHVPIDKFPMANRQEWERSYALKPLPTSMNTIYAVSQLMYKIGLFLSDLNDWDVKLSYGTHLNSSDVGGRNGLEARLAKGMEALGQFNDATKCLVDWVEKVKEQTSDHEPRRRVCRSK